MYLETADPATLPPIVEEGSGAGEAWAVFVAERSRPAVPALVDHLAGAGVTFFGGVFPALLHGDEVHEEGVALARLPSAVPPLLVEGFELEPLALPDHGACAPDEVDGGCTVVVLVDGLSSRIGPFLRALFHHFGNAVTYLGGGAGSLDLTRGPCLFTADGFVADAAVLAFVPCRSGVGVRHGWEPLLGPLVATRTARNVITELNWQEAFPVYRDVVAADAERPLDRDSFFDVARGYPFGMQRAGDECIVRDPVAVDAAGGLVCVGDVPENAVLEILKGCPPSLIRAAGDASRAALAGSDPARLRQALVFDCISRAVFLEDEFEEERRAITGPVRSAQPSLDIMGALSLGEIASRGQGMLAFLNKAVVVGLLHDP